MFFIDFLFPCAQCNISVCYFKSCHYTAQQKALQKLFIFKCLNLLNAKFTVPKTKKSG